MKKLLALMVCSSILSAAWATADGPDFYRIRDSASAPPRLALYAQPHGSAHVVATIPAEASCLRSKGCQAGGGSRWCQIEYQRTSGWIRGDKLAEGECKLPSDVATRIVQLKLTGKGTPIHVSGKIQGGDFIDYRVAAGAGQVLSVKFKAHNGQAYFNVLPPDSVEALFVGSMSGDSFQGLLPADGLYTVRVYLMRAAARRKESSPFTLDVSLTHEALKPLSAAQDALVEGTLYHAVGSVPCRYAYDSQLSSCRAYVIRRGFDGTATLVLRGGANYKRQLLFVKGEPKAADSVQALSYTKTSDQLTVKVGEDEQFELPEALLTGG